jgi:uncharacterized damage-inducible protein DinB
MTSTTVQTTEVALTGERADLLETLGKHRFFLRHTVANLTDEQAASRPTVSELSLGGLIKHVTAAERQWAEFIVKGATAMSDTSEEQLAVWAANFTMSPGETLADVLAAYEQVSAITDQLVRDLPDLDAGHLLPEAPWFEPGASWSARRVLLHIIAETSQHAGHADILRETIDGQKSMG